MDKRIKYLIGLDTETLNGIVIDDKIDLSQALVYDLGWAVVDKKGRVYRQRSFVIADTFCDMKEQMKSAYYANKIPNYWEDIKSGRRELRTFNYVRSIFLHDMAEFNVDTVFAHNAGFDLRALNNTIRYLSKSKCRYFFPYGTVIWDTLKMATDVFSSMPTYRNFCETNGYMTRHKTPRPRMTAEILTKFLSGNYDFEESHTGLEDVLIEKDILARCFRSHKKMRKLLFA